MSIIKLGIKLIKTCIATKRKNNAGITNRSANTNVPNLEVRKFSSLSSLCCTVFIFDFSDLELQIKIRSEIIPMIGLNFVIYHMTDRTLDQRKYITVPPILRSFIDKICSNYDKLTQDHIAYTSEYLCITTLDRMRLDIYDLKHYVLLTTIDYQSLGLEKTTIDAVVCYYDDIYLIAGYYLYIMTNLPTFIPIAELEGAIESVASIKLSPSRAIIRSKLYCSKELYDIILHPSKNRIDGKPEVELQCSPNLPLISGINRYRNLYLNHLDEFNYYHSSEVMINHANAISGSGEAVYRIHMSNHILIGSWTQSKYRPYPFPSIVGFRGNELTVVRIEDAVVIFKLHIEGILCIEGTEFAPSHFSVISEVGDIRTISLFQINEDQTISEIGSETYQGVYRCIALPYYRFQYNVLLKPMMSFTDLNIITP